MGEFLAAEALLTTTELFGAAELASSAGAAAGAFEAGAGWAVTGADLAGGGLFTGGGAALSGLNFGIGDVFSGIGAISALAGGRQGQVSAEFEAAQFREEQENARVAAAQDEAQRRRQLSRTLSSITAIRAGRGVELFGGGTGEAIRRQVTTEAEEDITTSRLNFLNRSRRFGLAAGQAEAKGTGELLGGFGTAAAVLGRGFART